MQHASPIETVGIVGRGIIGASWAIVFARSGLRVRIWCRKPEATEEVTAHLAASLEALQGTGLEGDARTLDRITVHTSIAETLADVDYVQESVSEDEQLKHEMLTRIEAHAPQHAIIGSSTSGIMPSRMATALAHPERFLVVHPLTPPHLLPVTELCAAPQTSPAVVDRVREWLRALGQHPIMIRAEVAGFALNRLLGALLNECYALIRDGVLDPADVDPLLTEGFGLRWRTIGPFASMDLNAPGGIADYLARYGSIAETVARSRGATPALTEQLIDEIGAAVPSVDETQDRFALARVRDRRIAEMRAARDRIVGRGAHG